MDKNSNNIDIIDNVNDVISLIENHPFAFIFTALGFGIGILIDNKIKNKEME